MYFSLLLLFVRWLLLLWSLSSLAWTACNSQHLAQPLKRLVLARSYFSSLLFRCWVCKGNLFYNASWQILTYVQRYADDGMETRGSKSENCVTTLYCNIISIMALVLVFLTQGYPVSGLWYAFLMVAMQVHIFTLLFAWRLIISWKGKSVKKAQ